MTRVLVAGAGLARCTVVDCGFSVEADEELSFDTLAPRRNGATLAVLSSADRVLVVGAADPAGMERLVRCLEDLNDVLPEVRPEVVLNRVRGSAATAGEAAAALRRFTGLDAIALLPEDRASTDAAWRRGERLSVVAPKSPLRTAMADLATALTSAQSMRVPVPQ